MSTEAEPSYAPGGSDRDGRTRSRDVLASLFGRLGAARTVTVDLAFRAWRYLHPEATFGDFYTAVVGYGLDRGLAHNSLGSLAFRRRGAIAPGDRHDRDSFAATGRGKFDNIIALAGLSPYDVVVDFGCGSLRVGQHFMRQVEPGNYWGLDLTDRFYRDGAALLGEAEMARLRPNLHVIDDAALARAAAARPSLVVSIGVLQHVPRAEWATYFDRLVSLTSDHTRLVVNFTAGAGAGAGRIGNTSWCYRADDIEAEIARRRPGARFLIRQGVIKQKGAHVAGRAYLLATWPAFDPRSARPTAAPGAASGLAVPAAAAGAGRPGAA